MRMNANSPRDKDNEQKRYWEGAPYEEGRTIVDETIEPLLFLVVVIFCCLYFL